MAGIKRKSAGAAQPDVKSKSKKIKVDKPATKRSSDKDAIKSTKSSKKAKRDDDSDELMESDTSEVENGFYGFSANKSPDANDVSMDDAGGFVGDALEAALDEDTKKDKKKKEKKEKKEKDGKTERSKDKKDSKDSEDKSSGLAGLNATSSREAHAKQKALAKERKAAKPNAEVVEQLKELWEKLRLKANVSAQERKDLIDKTFELVTGRIKEFVFKHDSVRVIQSALKYTHSMEQRRIIAQELKGEFKGLAEGKYSKFLIAKLLEKGDAEIRGMIIQEFYGNVRRLINHPEASWILDDTYRQVATPEQKARLLREWYGPEFSIKGLDDKGLATADLNTILEKSPEKRKPIMDYLESNINQLIQKKQTGFTMLHDAMLQYFLTCKPNTTEASDFLDHLKPDPTLKEGEEADNVDLLRNLAFTKPGSRLVSLAFAYGAAKDRKILLRPYKDTIETMAYDQNAHHVLLAALACTDDTKLTTKSIFGELLPAIGSEQLSEKIQNLSNDTRARIVLLYPFAGDSKWLFDEETRVRLAEVYKVREVTSKKAPETRLQELARNIEPQLLTAVSQHAEYLATTHLGCQLIGEVLVAAPDVEPEMRKEALKKVAGLSQQIIDAGGQITSHGKNMLKMLVQGGKFDPKAKKVIPVDPPLNFADLFWDQIKKKKQLLTWATGEGSFVIVGLIESENFERKDEVLEALRKDRKQLQEAAGPARDTTQKKGKKGAAPQAKGNAGARILLEKL